MTTKQGRAYYPLFDYLRISLALVVMFVHAQADLWGPSGKLAVDVFFALSGWLIGGLLLETNKSGLPRFYFNRAIRIWIPYYIALLLLITPSILMDALNYKWFEFTIYKITQVYNIFGPSQLVEFSQDMPLNGIGNHFWSVNAEEQFYLIAPLLLVFFPSIGRKLITWVVIIGVVWFFWIYPPITLGVVAALIKYNYPNFHEKTPCRIFLVVALAISFVCIYPAETFRDIEYRIFSPIIAISVVLLLAIKGRQSSFGEFFGGISYPLYLNHWIGIVITNRAMRYFALEATMLKYIALTLINIAIAGFLYTKIEKVMLNKRNDYYNIELGKYLTFIAYGMVFIGSMFGIANLLY